MILVIPSSGISSEGLVEGDEDGLVLGESLGEADGDALGDSLGDEEGDVLGLVLGEVLGEVKRFKWPEDDGLDQREALIRFMCGRIATEPRDRRQSGP